MHLTKDMEHCVETPICEVFCGTYTCMTSLVRLLDFYFVLNFVWLLLKLSVKLSLLFPLHSKCINFNFLKAQCENTSKLCHEYQ